MGDFPYWRRSGASSDDVASVRNRMIDIRDELRARLDAIDNDLRDIHAQLEELTELVTRPAHLEDIPRD